MAGQLGLGRADQLTRAVLDLIGATRDARLVLDLADLVSWDSSGLAALITAQQRIDALPAAGMVIAGLPGLLRQRLRDAGIADRFVLADTTAQAVAMLSSPG